VMPHEFIRKMLPKWLRVRLRRALQGSNAWLFESRLKLLIRLARPVALHDGPWRESFDRLQAAGIHVLPVHFYLPYLAPPDFWLFDQMMFWQETVLLKALLSGNNNFEIGYCSSCLQHKDPGSLAATFPACDPKIHCPQSSWLRNLAPQPQ
jgi:hypothetical protein